jgi:hypothetical protein
MGFSLNEKEQAEHENEKVILDDIGPNPELTYNGNYDIQVVGMDQNDIINISQNRSISERATKDQDDKIKIENEVYVEEEADAKERSIASSKGSKRIKKLQ